MVVWKFPAISLNYRSHLYNGQTFYDLNRIAAPNFLNIYFLYQLSIDAYIWFWQEGTVWVFYNKYYR